MNKPPGPTWPCATDWRSFRELLDGLLFLGDGAGRSDANHRRRPRGRDGRRWRRGTPDPGTLAAWQALRTLATADPQDPGASCKPFDKRRCGLVLGEGAAAFVLEDEAHARARGARILGFLSGYGNTCDAVHMSRPDRGGQTRAMREALRESGLAAQDIGYINAHGTATAVGDVVEAEAINAVFGGQRRCA